MELKSGPRKKNKRRRKKRAFYPKARCARQVKAKPRKGQWKQESSQRNRIRAQAHGNSYRQPSKMAYDKPKKANAGVEILKGPRAAAWPHHNILHVQGRHGSPPKLDLVAARLRLKPYCNPKANEVVPQFVDRNAACASLSHRTRANHQPGPPHPCPLPLTMVRSFPRRMPKVLSLWFWGRKKIIAPPLVFSFGPGGAKQTKKNNFPRIPKSLE